MQFFNRDMSNIPDFNVGIVLPASGTGERMGVSKPKQFCELLGKPLILFTISTFHRWPWIRYIIVVVAEVHKEAVASLVSEYDLHKVSIVIGGTTRHRSIYNGIKAVAGVCASPEVVLVHDAVRLFAEEDLVRDIAVAAHKFGAAGVSRPLVSTVISTDSDGMLAESLDRNKYCGSEMPQGFSYKVIRQAYDKISEHDLDHGTECLHLASKYSGVPARIIPGQAYLWKVTHKRDMYAAEGMLKEALLTVCILCPAGCEADADCLHHVLVCDLGAEKVQSVSLPLSRHSLTLQPNTVVHFYSDPWTDHLDLDLGSHWTASRLIDLCHVCVFRVSAATLESAHYKMCVFFKELARTLRRQHVHIFAVAALTGDTAEAIASVVRHIVWDQRTNLSGQVFLV